MAKSPLVERFGRYGFPALSAALGVVLAMVLHRNPAALCGLVIALALGIGVLVSQLFAGQRTARAQAAGQRALAHETAELRRRNEALEATSAERAVELETLTKSFAHDLKSPLGAILNFTAILEVDHPERWDADSAEILTRIRRSAARATAMLEGLARLARLGRIELAPEPLDMEELAHNAFAQARTPGLDDDIELVIEPLPAARGDRTLVTEALRHLFDNALKYSRGREKRRVTVRGSDAGAQSLYAVADNGRGFDMRYADKLFGVFERLHPAPAVPGSGVGLALVKRIVDRHGGRIWAESELERGSRFQFTLPRECAQPT
jgi:light-regulated signal transduction histidine kinase (bacteriophytochrome)